MKATGGTCNVSENPTGGNSYFRRLLPPDLSGVAFGSSTHWLARNFHQQNLCTDWCFRWHSEKAGIESLPAELIDVAAAAIRHAAVRLAATCGRRRWAALRIDRKG